MIALTIACEERVFSAAEPFSVRGIIIMSLVYLLFTLFLHVCICDSSFLSPMYLSSDFAKKCTEF